MTVRVVLSLEDFRRLVRGMVVRSEAQGKMPPVEVALADIGFKAMFDEVVNAAWYRALGKP